MNSQLARRMGLVVFVCVAVSAIAYFVWGAYREQPVPSSAKVRVVRPAGDYKVLIVHSYHPEYPWVQNISAGIEKGLEKSASEVRTFYMDTKRKNDEASKTAAGQHAADLVTEWKPAVVIACDDDAQKYFASRYAGRKTPQVVFCAVNGDAGDYGYPTSNVTGVLERPYFDETLKFLDVLCPGFKRIALISEESSTSDLAYRFMQTTAPTFEIVSKTKCGDFDEWKKAVLDAQDKAGAIGVYTYHSLKKAGTGDHMDPAEVMRWTVANSNVPVVGFLDFAIADGALCGMVESGEEQGLRAGQLARMLLRGRKASEFPVVETGLHGRKLLNVDTARTKGIKIPDHLPGLVETLGSSTPAVEAAR
jgi:ABC-type uncharacterized transport system substrate-binding protein